MLSAAWPALRQLEVGVRWVRGGLDRTSLGQVGDRRVDTHEMAEYLTALGRR